MPVMSQCKHALAGAVLLAICASAPPARAQSDERDLAAFESRRQDTLRTRRSLADSVLIAGLVSLAGGGALIVPSGDDEAWRAAGVNTAIFGAFNTLIGGLALHGIAAEQRSFDSSDARAARRTQGGLARAKLHAVLDERRESVAHAINLGLDCAYLGVGGTAIAASQLGVDHPNRWLASGVAIGVQALFLVVVDLVGLVRSGSDHHAFLESLSPSVAFTSSADARQLQLGVGGSF